MKTFFSVFFAILAAAAVIAWIASNRISAAAEARNEISFHRTMVKSLGDDLGYMSKEKYLEKIHERISDMKKSREHAALSIDIEDVEKLLKMVESADPGDKSFFKQ